MRNITGILLLLISVQLFAQSDHPQIPKTGTNINAFVPKGWKIIYRAKGDLNKDHLPDEAIIIQNTNPKNIIKNDGMGSDQLNVNPRMLLVLFKTSGNYSLQAQNTNFIPTENDAENTCLADPLQETGAISIKNGVLILSYQYWLSCGSYGVSNVDYTFRFQNQKMELIGFQTGEYSRSSGEENITSINFSTRKKSETSGGNMFSDKTNKPKTVWKKFNWGRLFTLDEMTEELTQKFSEI
ncbi:hypothetical protein SAMN05421827_10368 [Pedobacter terrae]|uniref:Uncharacterized protein n=1 Tax=Pedobacter terrae TaxID=405671 RepID=A0A1G7R4L1_9SPHI|nr:hypothetical protein [Pedobacter terrae]SDG05654.1 hypothetical protein SAMN05421827_10368 [Pedobacter terrae]